MSKKGILGLTVSASHNEFIDRVAAVASVDHERHVLVSTKASTFQVSSMTEPDYQPG